MPNKSEERDTTWHELDEAIERSYMRALITGMREGESDDYFRLIRQYAKLHRIVQEEIAAELSKDINVDVENLNTSNFEACAKLVEHIERQLNEIGGLVFKYPGQSLPARLTVSRTPPDENHLWLQLEPLDPSSLLPAVRLHKRVLLNLELMPEQTKQGPHGRTLGHGPS